MRWENEVCETRARTREMEERERVSCAVMVEVNDHKISGRVMVVEADAEGHLMWKDMIKALQVLPDTEGRTCLV